MPDQARRSGRRAGRLLLWAERLLLIAGAAALVWCGVLIGDAVMAQRSARSALEAARLAETSLVRPAVNAPTVPRPDSPTRPGDPVAALSIPRIDLSAVVLHGSDAHTLLRGPGHLENTALPGESGNVVIAGHRDSFFRPLRHTQVGDDVYMDTSKGRFHYRVTSLRVVKARDVSVLEPTDEATLTLITCYPFWILGNAPDRYVVRATRVVEANAARSEPRTLPTLGRVDAPATARPPVMGLASTTTKAPDGDEALVRQAIDRFRDAFNANLVSSYGAPFGEPLKFQACEITVTGGRATAICDARTYLLERADQGWAIRSIVSDDADVEPTSEQNDSTWGAGPATPSAPPTPGK